MEKKRDTTGIILTVASAALVLTGLGLAFLWAPHEITMKEVQRIFYFHVAVDWVGFLAFFVTLVASVAYLRSHDRKWDIVAMSSVEIGALFLTMGAVSGSLWARPAWNTWWTWDARLTTVAITWLVYVAYLMLRSAIDDPQRRARFSAVYGIVGFVTVPLTFASIFFLRTIHPALFAASAAAQGSMQFETGLASAKMGMTLTFCVTAFTVLYVTLLRARIKVEQMADRVARLQQEIVSA
jgi:heme exporter protein C